MITVPAGVRVYLAMGPTDMRKGTDSLSMLVQELLKLDPFSGHLFAFRGRRGGYPTQLIEPVTRLPKLTLCRGCRRGRGSEIFVDIERLAASRVEGCVELRGTLSLLGEIYSRWAPLPDRHECRRRSLLFLGDLFLKVFEPVDASFDCDGEPGTIVRQLRIG
jgi:transposase